jgi:hypothetical protein
MPIDSNIALGIRPPQFESPVNTLASVLGVQQAQQQNQINRMKMDAYGQEQERQNKLYSLLGSVDPSTGDEGRANALYGGGFLNEAEAVRKGASERQRAAAQAQKDSAEAASKAFNDNVKRLDYTGQAMRFVMQNPTLENAHMTIDVLNQAGVLSNDQAAQYKATTAANPGSIRALAEAQFRATLESKNQLLKETTRNTGGMTDTLMSDPVNGTASVVNSVKNTQTPDSVASNARMAADAAAGRAVTRRGQDLTDARAREQAAATSAGTGKLTEDQGKATGWLVQADNAFGNMKKALEADPSAARPGINDAIAAIPSFGLGEVIGNSMRSEARQMFMQGASSLSEALLRAATGAGVNKDEAVQKIKELTPVFGEAAATTKQKMDAIPLYIESLKVRAGPGAKQLPGIVERATNASPSGFKYLGKVQ